MRSPKLGRLLVGAMVLAGILVGAGALPASADGSVPWSDPQALGYIGLCNKDRQPVTSGSLTEQPFVWTAVSSQAAPQTYAKGLATLYAYQPRKGIPPGEWSGYQLSGSSTFTNPQNPMAAGTYADPPLLSFVGSFPPKWQGLVQLRMFLSGPNAGVFSQQYPATTIRITGDTWTVVQGGTPACDAGTARSREEDLLPKSAWQSPTMKVTDHPSASATQSGGAANAQPSGGGEQNLAAGSATNDSGGGSGLAGFGLAGLAVIGAAIGLFYIWRRSTHASG